MRTYAPAFLLAAGAFAAITAADGRSATEFIAGGAVALSAIIVSGRRLADAAVFAFGFISIYVTALALAPTHIECGTAGTYTAVVESMRCGEKSQRGTCTLLDSAGRRMDGRRIALTIADIVPEVAPGDIVLFEAELRPTGRYKDIPILGIQDSYERSMRVSAKAVVFRDGLTVTGHSHEWRFVPDGIRRTLEEHIYASQLPPDAARMLAACTLGGDIDTESSQAMRDAGISHLLCISGFHVGVVAAVAALLLWPLIFAERLRRYRSHITLICVWGYALVAGFTPSVVRAAIMLSSFFIARILQRDTLSLNALALAFYLVLLLDPYNLFSAGFQLSFAAVAGLLLFARQINPVSPRRRIAHRAAALTFTPFAAMIATAPLMLLWFNRLPLSGIAANAIVAAIFPLYMCSGALTVLLGSAGIPAGAVASASDTLYRLIIWLSHFWADASNAISPAIYADTACLCALSAAIVAAAVLVNSNNRLRKRVAAACIALSVAVSGCSGPQTDSMIVADSYGNASSIVHAGSGTMRCFLADADTIAGEPYRRIATAYKAKTETVVLKADTCTALPDGRSVYVASGRGEPLPAKCDILLVSRKYKGELAPLLSALQPGTVLLSGALDYERRHAYTAACVRTSTPCHDLAEKAVALR